MEAQQYRLKIGPQDIELRLGETLVGRSEECGICLDDDRLSRVHAKLLVSEEKAEILDLGSRNGTHVNEVQVKDRMTLQGGDRIRVGQTVMQFLVTGKRVRRSSSRTLGGPTLLDIAPPETEEADLLQRMLQKGKVEEAEKLLKSRVANLVRTDPPLRVDHLLSRSVVGGLIAITEKSMDPRWLHRLFKLFAACGWWMSDETQKRVEQLIRALGRVGGDGIVEYLAHWGAEELTEAQKAQLARLEELASRTPGSWPA
ncbi:MAG: FHA domain-containing protein [Polyangia bacterium]|jgi:pSer/pThr/pTyr-binding forkhead associated (FHA) protein|nr:FHA domain-containing protein [Polyangia bacterium]